VGRSIVVAALALVGLLCAAGMGYAAYVVSRGSVAVPVTRLEQRPQKLTPQSVKAKPARNRTTTRRVTPPPPPPPVTTTDDHGGDRHGGSSGSGGGGHGRDD